MPEPNEEKQAQEQNNDTKQTDSGAEDKKFRMTEDGIQLKSDDQTGPEAGPDEGQPGRDSHEGDQGEDGTQTGKQEQQGQDTATDQKRSEAAEDFANLPDDKKVDQYDHLIRKFGEISSEIGELRKEVSQRDKSPEEMYQEMSSEQLTDALAETLTELETLEQSEDADPEELKEKRMLRYKLEADIVNKRADEAIRQRLDSHDNQQFQQKVRDHFTDQGIEMTDDEFQDVTETAQRYTQDGKLDESAYFKAMIDSYGLDKMRKVEQMNAEQKTRKEIKDAERKSGDKLRAQGSGKDTGWKPLAGKSEAEVAQQLDNLDPDTIHEMREEIDQAVGA